MKPSRYTLLTPRPGLGASLSQLPEARMTEQLAASCSLRVLILLRLVAAAWAGCKWYSPLWKQNLDSAPYVSISPERCHSQYYVDFRKTKIIFM